MPEVRFYHLQRQGLEEALPKLVEKIYSTGLKVIIKTADVEMQDKLDRALWEYSSASFIPHDISGCKQSDIQPIYLTTVDENPTKATIQIIVNAAESNITQDFERCLYMFDGRDENIVTAARTAWKALKDKDWEMSYWQQREVGGWEKKA